MIAILWETADGRWKVLDMGGDCAGVRPTLEEARDAAANWGYRVLSIVRLL